MRFVESGLTLRLWHTISFAMRRGAILISLLLGACDLSSAAQPQADAAAPAQARLAQEPLGPVFPAPDRPVADIVSAAWSDEESRDNAGEATQVFRLLKVKPGLSVADIGAGSGYYTSRLAPAVGPSGIVHANDIIPDYLTRLRRRMESEGHGNVRFVLGDAGNANLPPQSVDIALMVHMYHEISDPFGLLWHLHEDLKPGGRVAIIDANRATARHGTPPSLLTCELAAAGFRQASFNRLGNGSYLAVFEPVARPEPAAIKPCRAE
jgi:predicted methyltransferase